MARMLAAIVAPLLALSLLVPSARASEAEDLYEAMRLGDILEIMREEGLAYGRDLRSEMFPEQGAMGWPRVVDGIYSLERMEGAFLAAFEEAIGGRDLSEAMAFFSSPAGRDIVGYEVSARRALLDEGVEEAARMIWQDLEGEVDTRRDLIERFVEANDLIEANVAGAMNSTLAFYEGLSSSDAFGAAWTTDRILSTVWAQETAIRADTIDWVYPYLTLAFEPLPEDDIEAYIDLSRSAQGEVLNSALFTAFDLLFVNISRKMGEAAALYLEGEDI